MTCPPSNAGIGSIFMKAKMIEIKAVLAQKPFQFQVEGNMFPIAPNPPN